MKKKFRHLVIISHPDQKSFCYNGIFKTIIRQMRKHKEIYKVIDLYEDKLHNDRDDLIKEYQDLITWSTHIYIVSPVWWFRLTPKLETFFDQVLTPGFAYKFVNITKLYAFPKPFLKDKYVVEATVLRHLSGSKTRVYKMRPKKKTRKTFGFRPKLTRVYIYSICNISAPSSVCYL